MKKQLTTKISGKSYHRSAVREITVSLLTAVILGTVFGAYVTGNAQESEASRAKVFQMTADQSLADVRDAIRVWRAEAPQRENVPVEVVIEPGIYYLAEPVEFTPEDSNVVYRASQPGTAVFTRGRDIGGWTVNEQGWFVTHLPEVADGVWWFDTLFVNGNRATLACSPNEFYYYIDDIPENPVDPITGEQQNDVRNFFCPRPENTELFTALAAKDPKRYPLSDVQIKFYFSWESSLHRLARIVTRPQQGDRDGVVMDDSGSSPPAVIFQNPAVWPLNYWGRNLRYRIAGFPEALDVPGEFYLDRDGTLTYIPFPGQMPENTAFRAPVAVQDAEKSPFIRIQGDMTELVGKLKASDRYPEGMIDNDSLYVRNLTFDGLAFSVDAFQLPETGLMCGQAATSSPAAIVIDGAKNVWFRNGEISDLGGWGISFRNACYDSGIEQTMLRDLGAGGVQVGGQPVSQNITVKNNIIRHYGLNDAGATGIWIANAQNSSIVHNDISDGFYTGISVGWVWGYAKSLTHHNKIEFNHIHHIGHGVLSDMGGVYSLGVSPGTSVSNNVIHDVYSYNRFGRGGWGLYTDEGSSDMTLENNLVYRVHTGMFHQHYGRENRIRNNILAFSLDGQIQRSRSEEHTSFFFENNIVLWDRSPLLASSWQDGHYCMKNNLYWFCGQPQTDDEKAGRFFAGKTLAEWQETGQDQGSLMADPEFVDPNHGDFHFKGGTPNAAVQAIGFKPFDYTKAGLEGEDAWKNKVNEFVNPPLKLAPDGPPVRPVNLRDTFENKRIRLVPEAVMNDENIENAFVILEEKDNRFLRLNDSDKFQYSYDPHFYYHPNYTEGTAICEFDLRISEQATLHVEGRDYPYPYQIGPSLVFDQGKVYSNGQELGNIPTDQWLHAKMVCSVGENWDDFWTFSLCLRDDDRNGGEVVVPETRIPVLHQDWKFLDWFGFCALNNNTATIDIDNIVLINQVSQP